MSVEIEITAAEAKKLTAAAKENVDVSRIMNAIKTHAALGRTACTVNKIDDLEKAKLERLGYKVEYSGCQRDSYYKVSW